MENAEEGNSTSDVSLNGSGTPDRFPDRSPDQSHDRSPDRSTNRSPDSSPDAIGSIPTSQSSSTQSGRVPENAHPAKGSVSSEMKRDESRVGTVVVGFSHGTAYLHTFLRDVFSAVFDWAEKVRSRLQGRVYYS